MQQTTSVAIVATQLAHTDRRALSQAWYSALHLAEHAAPKPRSASSARVVAPPSRAGAVADAGNVRGGTPQSHPSSTGAALRGAMTHAADRRAPKTELARRIERALTRRVPREGQASFAVRAAGGRVQLIVRADGERVRVVAVCATTLRERVDRALAQARFALAGRGVRAEVA